MLQEVVANVMTVVIAVFVVVVMVSTLARMRSARRRRKIMEARFDMITGGRYRDR